MAERSRAGRPPARHSGEPPTGPRPVRPAASENYVIQIERWDWSLHFGLNPTRGEHRPEPFTDYRHIKITGRLLRPAVGKVKAARLTILPTFQVNPELAEDYPSAYEPQAIGGISVSRGEISGPITIPHDALAPLLTMLAAGRIGFVVLEGDPIEGREARIRFVSFHTEYDLADLLSPKPQKTGKARTKAV